MTKSRDTQKHGEFSISFEHPAKFLDGIICDFLTRKSYRGELIPKVNVPCTERADGERRRSKTGLFRRRLLLNLRSAWISDFGLSEAGRLCDTFTDMAITFEEQGALLFKSLITRAAFSKLVEGYERLLGRHGNNAPLHSYLDLSKFPGFLSNDRFNKAFLHPLFITLIGYRMGEPILLTDVRAKDTHPAAACVQDNMLHIDHTPFRSELKVIITWQKGQTTGPVGQNFVFIPGSNRCARKIYYNDAGQAYATENGSIFTTARCIENIFNSQIASGASSEPTVIEVQHASWPMVALFDAGSLVHHGYRTAAGRSRSAIILTFHSCSDARASRSTVFDEGLDGSYFQNALLGSTGGRSFIYWVRRSSYELGRTLLEIADGPQDIIWIQQENMKMSPERLQTWASHVLSAPTIEKLKLEAGQKRGFTKTDLRLTRNGMLRFISFCMRYDKHGPLDLALYVDNREERRKGMRKHIREMSQRNLEQQLDSWRDAIRQPSVEHILGAKQLVEISKELQKMTRVGSEHIKAEMQSSLISLRCLARDLGESIVRCDSLQSVLSSSFFLFWCCNEFRALCNVDDKRCSRLGAKLLQHYVALAVLQLQTNGAAR